MNKIDEEQLLTVKQAAQYLQVAEKTVRKWIKDKKINACILPVNNIRIRKSDILSYQQAQKCTNTPKNAEICANVPSNA